MKNEAIKPGVHFPCDTTIIVRGSIVKVLGPRYGFQSDNAASFETGLPVETFRQAARMSSVENGVNTWTYSL